jgi:OPT family oligopeptide transporter
MSALHLPSQEPAEPEFPPVITGEPLISLRAVVTGAVLGGALAMANIYTGLKIGWGFNMSITAALLAFGLWALLVAIGATKRRFSLLENNLNQTGASAAASISSAGLVSAVPALTVLDGYQWGYFELATWILCCSLLGVFVAMLFRRQMLIKDRLTFANGIATAETLKEMYARGAEAMARVKALLTAGFLAAAWKITVTIAKIKALPFPGALPLSSDGAAAKAGVAAVSTGKVGFALDPGLLMVGGGMIIGVRVCTWMFVGAIIAWYGVGSYVIDQGWVGVALAERQMVLRVFDAAIYQGDSFSILVGASPGGWLLWPGVALLVTSSLASLIYVAPQFALALGLGRVLPATVRERMARERAADSGRDRTYEMPGRWLWSGVAVVTVVTLIAGHAFFGMHPLIGLAAVGLTGVLAIVALRVTGDTNVTPVGPMGKVTQLAFGAIDPGSVSTNLMAANVTGGSASQAGDMMHDLKAGLLIGSAPRAQSVSQLVGVVSGSLVGAAVYLVLMQGIGDKLMTPEWAAPAMVQWKAVAELFRDGFDKMPIGAFDAMLWAGVIGVVLTVLEKSLPKGLRKWAPSASAIGIAFIISAALSFSFFLGGLLGWALTRWVTGWYTRFGIVVAAGLIAGESITGMIETMVKVLAG